MKLLTNSTINNNFKLSTKTTRRIKMTETKVDPTKETGDLMQTRELNVGGDGETMPLPPLPSEPES